MFTDNDKAMESKKGGQSSFRQRIDPIKAKVDILIKQKLDKKHKGSNSYRRKRNNMLDMIEYYDYDEEQEGNALNEQETQNKDNKLSINAKIKRGKNVSIKFTLKPKTVNF